jgi:hypothetical protein
MQNVSRVSWHQPSPRRPPHPRPPVSEVLQRAAALGAATGMRSTVALAALVLRRSDGLPAVLRRPAARMTPAPRSPAAFRTR